jgi:hypothetical protein
MVEIAQSEEQLQQGREEVIHLQQRIRRIIDQIKEIDANALRSSSATG